MNKIHKTINKLIARLRPSGPYRFFIRDWSGQNDIDFVSRLLATETYRKVLVSRPLPLNELRSMTVLAPHQDDEIIGAGGACILARSQGCDVSIVYMTDGAQTGFGRQHGQGLEPDAVAQMRQDEARLVCDRLGADYRYIGFSNITMTPEWRHVEQLRSCLEEKKSCAVLLPWLLDGTPKHRAINHLLWLANKISPLPPCEVWGYQVNNPVLANAHVEITDVVDEKIEILELYESQNKNFRRYDHEARGMAAWNSRFLPSKDRNPIPRYAEIFSTLPLNEYLDLIEQFYFTNFSTTYMGNAKISLAMSGLHASIVSSR